MSRRIGLLGILVAAALLVAPALASPGQARADGDPIGPNQVFGGHVNGSTGRPRPAIIYMACVGPIQPGQTGHPMSGQTVDVFQPKEGGRHFGNTGPNGTSIGAFFGPPPPAASAGPSYVPFHRYDRRKPIPTSLELPCAGSGVVTFVPLPFFSPARSATVPVRYVGQP